MERGGWELNVDREQDQTPQGSVDPDAEMGLP